MIKTINYFLFIGLKFKRLFIMPLLREHCAILKLSSNFDFNNCTLIGALIPFSLLENFLKDFLIIPYFCHCLP
uniref:Uncharacterized protein n=1 Tax=Arundo donax TaxID=35708 RepID=A0A0A9EGF5_ARUDO